MASPGKLSANRIAAFCSILALCLMAGAARAPAESRLDQAREYYDQAMQAEAQLEQVPIALRAEASYASVIQAFRRVYLTAPAYGNDTLCLMDVGELSEGAALLFNQPKYFENGIAAYRFLLHEYPNSQFRFEARLDIARIYREDLHQAKEALQEYQQFISDYPHSAQSRQVQAAVAQLEDELGSKTAPVARVSPAPHPAPVAEASAPPQPAVVAEALPVPHAVAVVPAKVSLPPAKAAAAPLPAPSAPLASAAPATPSADAAPEEPLRPALISDVHYWTAPDDRRVVLDIERKVDYHIGRMDSPRRRLIIDLEDTRVSPPSGKTLVLEDETLQRVRLAQYKTNVCRLVLDLGSTAEYQLSELTNPYRLVIDVRSRSTQEAAGPAKGDSSAKAAAAGQAAAAASVSAAGAVVAAAAADATDVMVPQTVLVLAPSPASPNQSAPSAADLSSAADSSAGPPAPSAPPTAPLEQRPSLNSALKPAEPAGPELAAKPPMRDGTLSLSRALGLKIRRIVIDPGHGGHDTGTIGPGGLEEKALTLDLALRLGKLIEERLGSEVIYTRQDDSFVSLEQRAALANQVGADLFLSIHANSSSVPRVSGVETYYLSLTSDPGALEVAARENAASQETVSDLQGLVSKIALNEKVGESRELALRVQSALQKLGGSNSAHFNRGVKKAPFVVLIGAHMPSVLAEVSFLSNPEQEKRLRTPEYRQKIAEALYKGIASYVQTTGGAKPAPGATASAATAAQTASLR